MKCITRFLPQWLIYPVVSKGFMSVLKREHVATQSSSHSVVKEESGGHFKDTNLFPVLKCRGGVVALHFPEGRRRLSSPHQPHTVARKQSKDYINASN